MWFGSLLITTLVVSFCTPILSWIIIDSKNTSIEYYEESDDYPDDPDVKQDEKLNTPELIKKYGYPVEIHHVTTDDGYILELHRIPKEGGVPVLLVHGLLDASSTWVMMGPHKGFGDELQKKRNNKRDFNRKYLRHEKRKADQATKILKKYRSWSLGKKIEFLRPFLLFLNPCSYIPPLKQKTKNYKYNHRNFHESSYNDIYVKTIPIKTSQLLMKQEIENLEKGNQNGREGTTSKLIIPKSNSTQSNATTGTHVLTPHDTLSLAPQTDQMSTVWQDTTPLSSLNQRKQLTASDWNTIYGTSLRNFQYNNKKNT